jgi:hypothetical protein
LLLQSTNIRECEAAALEAYMEKLIEIAPECPVCESRHPQSFTREDLSELLKYESFTLYCPRLDKSWHAPREIRERLAHIAAGFARLGQTGSSLGITGQGSS